MCVIHELSGLAGPEDFVSALQPWICALHGTTGKLVPVSLGDDGVAASIAPPTALLRSLHQSSFGHQVMVWPDRDTEEFAFTAVPGQIPRKLYRSIVGAIASQPKGVDIVSNVLELGIDLGLAVSSEESAEWEASLSHGASAPSLLELQSVGVLMKLVGSIHGQEMIPSPGTIMCAALDALPPAEPLLSPETLLQLWQPLLSPTGPVTHKDIQRMQVLLKAARQCGTIVDAGENLLVPLALRLGTTNSPHTSDVAEKVAFMRLGLVNGCVPLHLYHRFMAILMGLNPEGFAPDDIR